MEKIINVTDCDDCPFSSNDVMGMCCHITGHTEEDYDKAPFMAQCPLKNTDGVLVKIDNDKVKSVEDY